MLRSIVARKLSTSDEHDRPEVQRTACAREEHVERARGLRRLHDRARDVVFLRHVGDDVADLDARSRHLLQLRRRGAEPILGAPADRDVRPVGREPLRRAETDPTAASGYERGEPFDTCHATAGDDRPRRSATNSAIRADARFRLGDARTEDVPDVDHLRPHLEGDVDAGPRRAFREGDRVVAQDLDLADVDEQRRQSGRVGEQRRDQRLGRVGAARRTSRPYVAGRRACTIGSWSAIAVIDGAREGEIGPRRDRNAECRQRPAAIAQREQGREGEPASRRVAGHDDAIGFEALGRGATRTR